ncbi:1-deoxy-D-xylulose-5-phosphate synthase [Nakamurella sp. YIM 132084]|uniref:1-deoxy-D-xylulose-5-phosphate synthase n=1 Tax=Nakamurella leprariae TaxID=2803911 RepID=A0A938YFX2_9ACTN|nr:1-deoxy-D-xylulose-5-phosphate synthase [Nakamurella leprariae]MBM9467088.1 1-deoxy-D-xylulose-5-phosphate synthase [Nakamurella leprariae]
MQRSEVVPAGTVLSRIATPADLRALGPDELDALAGEIRDFLVQQVSRRGGHLGPNLGVVELTLALHRVFDSPSDPVLFDTGHQAYVHKIVTGRAGDFDRLRTRGGLSGYPNRAESPHDWIENSHASTSLSYADGMAKAFALRGEHDRTVVAVIGDGALTGGMAWEALNNIAAAKDRPVVVVLNDNGRSYAPTIGGMAQKMAALRLRPGYEQMLAQVKATVERTPVVGPPLYSGLHAAKTAVKDWLLPPAMFSDLGLKYVGPIDGHDIAGLELALSQARGFRGPVLVHVLTDKGRGYAPAEQDDAELMHSPPAFDPATGQPVAAASTTWTQVFGRELVRIGTVRPDVVAITAAMAGPTGLQPFGRAFGDRLFDVGIAEQHAVASAAGLALGGMHPVVAVYATFLNRAFDQLLLDAAMHRLPVTVVLDRAGVTGEDGPSHHGMWDLSLAAMVPGLRVAAPRDAVSLAAELDEAVAVQDGPTLLRFPKGAVPAPVLAVRRIPPTGIDAGFDAETGAETAPAGAAADGELGPFGAIDVLAEPGPDRAAEVLLVAVGAFGATAVEVAERLAAQGISVRAVDPRWVLPVPAALVELARGHRLVVTLEDGGRSGGVGAAVADALAGTGVPVRILGLPQQFLEPAPRAELLRDLGLSAQAIARGITEQIAGLTESTGGTAKRVAADAG